jgi:cytochrome c-type biogenesis protein CcmH
MTGFLIAALLVLLTVTARLMLPLLAPRARGGEADERPALRILREQRRELEAELAARRISIAAHAESIAEIESRAAAEMQAVEVPQAVRPARGWALLVGLGLPVAAIALYLILGQPAGLNPANTAPAKPLGVPDIAAMVDRLAEKVRTHPDDIEATRMLARSYMVLERYKDAVAVYQQLARRVPDDAQLYADWADALGGANGNSMNGEPAELVTRALAIDPDNVKALALAGSMAFENKEYHEAQKLWTRLSTHVDPQSEIGRSVQAMLEEVARRLGEAPKAPVALGLKLSGVIRIADSLKDAAAAGDVLFVFVRPAAGGPPVAALRLPAGQWPLPFDFSSAPLMAESPGNGPYVIGARISKSGDASAVSGDPEGFSGVIMPDTHDITIEIAGRRP